MNRLSNSRATSDLDRSLQPARFGGGDAEATWGRIDAKASPARRLCDLFWFSLPWGRIASELHGDVRVLEIGCGNGRCGVLVRECLGNVFGGYVGLDVTPHPGWESYRSDSKVKLVCADSGSTTKYLADANLIVTQSALEHFEGDLIFFRKITDYIACADRPIIQFHLMPSAACLTTFPWHGVCQNTPRTVSRITRLFGSETSKRLCFLGSAACYRLHRRYITYPALLGNGDQRQARLTAYGHELRQAMQQDDAAPKRGEASFLALVLQSRLAGEIVPSLQSSP